MDAHELMLRRSQDICVLALVNVRFSILKKQKPTKLNLSIADGPRRPRRSKFEFSFVGNDRRPSRKPGTRRENRNAPDSPDLSPFIPDDRGYLRFSVFISRENLGRSGNREIPDRLGFSRHMKTRL